MKKLMIILLLTIFAGCTYLSQSKMEEKYGKGSPKILFATASPMIRSGDTWKIYLSAFDPDGDMDLIVAKIEQPGGIEYESDYTQIKEGMKKNLKGYLTLNTISYTNLWGFNLKLILFIMDKVGHISNKVELPLEFGNKLKPPTKPVPKGYENFLGAIMIELRAPEREHPRLRVPEKN